MRKRPHGTIRLLIAGFLSTASLGLVCSALWPWWSVQPARPHTNTDKVSPKPVVALLAHQDDEMFFAGSLRRYVNSGRPVYAVIVTDGAGSVVRRSLGLSSQAFSAARNREVFASMRTIGVLPERIIFANPNGMIGASVPKYNDTLLSVEKAQAAIARIYDQVGNGTYITLASGPGEAHFRNPDHWNLQKALQQFKGIQEKIYFSDIGSEKSETIELTAGEQRVKQNALQSYYVWDPSQGRYAIGKRSVPYLLNHWQTSTVEYMIK